MNSTAQISVEHDKENDILIICGVRYSCELFRGLGFGAPGTWLRIVERRDQALTVYSVDDKTQSMFDSLCGYQARAK